MSAQVSAWDYINNEKSALTLAWNIETAEVIFESTYKNEKYLALIQEIKEAMCLATGRDANSDAMTVDSWFMFLFDIPALEHPQIPDWIKRIKALIQEFLAVKNRKGAVDIPGSNKILVKSSGFADAFKLLPELGTCVDTLLDVPFTNSGEIFRLFEEIEDALGCDHYRVGGEPGVPAWIARIYGMDYISFREWFPNVTLDVLEGWLSTMREILG